MPAYMAVLYRSSASEGRGRDQPPAADNRRDQHAGNTVNRYEDAEAEFMSEGVVQDLVKGTSKQNSRVELTPGRQNLRKRQDRDPRRPEVFYDLPIDGHDWYPGPNEDDQACARQRMGRGEGISKRECRGYLTINEHKNSIMK